MGKCGPLGGRTCLQVVGDELMVVERQCPSCSWFVGGMNGRGGRGLCGGQTVSGVSGDFACLPFSLQS